MHAAGPSMLATSVEPMSGMASAGSSPACTQPSCDGSIDADGYCDTCGMKVSSGGASAGVTKPASPPGPGSGVAVNRQAGNAVASPTPRQAKSPGAICGRDGCSGTIIADGYCDTCGLSAQSAGGAPAGGSTSAAQSSPTQGTGSMPSIAVPVAPNASTTGQTADSPSGRTRVNSSRRTGSTRSGLGLGMVVVPPTEVGDPALAVMSEDRIQQVLGVVAEDERSCSSCGKPVGRATGGVEGRVEGFCGNCREPFNFVTNRPSLSPGELVAGQYEILGPLAHGGMGWIYLGKDNAVSDRWVVLKGLLNQDDPDAIAAAVAERRFLAQIEHANIVNIYNFVSHRGAGYIVMEMVGGESLNAKLKNRRAANNGIPDPLDIPDAIAYMLGILPALGYLHDLGLVYNDLKPANVMAVGDDVKLIDVGAVMRSDDVQAAIFGTEGFQAPEVATHGPSVQSDLYTVGRTLAVLVIRFVFHTGEYQYSIPDQVAEPLFRQWESLYRFLLKATAYHPDDRFQTAGEMTEQLSGVLRELVAVSDGQPRSSVSHHFESDRTAQLLLDNVDAAAASGPYWRILPPARVNEDSPDAQIVLDLLDLRPTENVEKIRIGIETLGHQATHELTLRYAWEIILLTGEAVTANHGYPKASQLLAAVAAEDPWEWRVSWYEGVLLLTRGRYGEAAEKFNRVWTEVPGETAPKVAVALAAELAGQLDRAEELYDLVSRSDSSYVSAAFGLARCRLARAKADAAVEALNRVPATSAAYYDAQVAAARTLAGGGFSTRVPAMVELKAASDIVERLQLDASERASISAEIFEQALAKVDAGANNGGVSRLLGKALTMEQLQMGLHDVYREQARLADSPALREELIDKANQVRPWSWF